MDIIYFLLLPVLVNGESEEEHENRFESVNNLLVPARLDLDTDYEELPFQERMIDNESSPFRPDKSSLDYDSVIDYFKQSPEKARKILGDGVPDLNKYQNKYAETKEDYDNERDPFAWNHANEERIPNYGNVAADNFEGDQRGEEVSGFLPSVKNEETSQLHTEVGKNVDATKQISMNARETDSYSFVPATSDFKDDRLFNKKEGISDEISPGGIENGLASGLGQSDFSRDGNGRHAPKTFAELIRPLEKAKVGETMFGEKNQNSGQKFEVTEKIQVQNGASSNKGAKAGYDDRLWCNEKSNVNQKNLQRDEDTKYGKEVNPARRISGPGSIETNNENQVTNTNRIKGEESIDMKNEKISSHTNSFETSAPIDKNDDKIVQRKYKGDGSLEAMIEYLTKQETRTEMSKRIHDIDRKINALRKYSEKVLDNPTLLSTKDWNSSRQNENNKSEDLVDNMNSKTNEPKYEKELKDSIKRKESFETSLGKGKSSWDFHISQGVSDAEQKEAELSNLSGNSGVRQSNRASSGALEHSNMWNKNENAEDLNEPRSLNVENIDSDQQRSPLKSLLKGNQNFTDLVYLTRIRPKLMNPFWFIENELKLRPFDKLFMREDDYGKRTKSSDLFGPWEDPFSIFAILGREPAKQALKVREGINSNKNFD